MNDAIGTRLNTIVDYGRNMGKKVSDFWQYARSIDITINPKAIVEGTEALIKKAAGSINSLSNNDLRGLSVAELGIRLEGKLNENIIGGV